MERLIVEPVAPYGMEYDPLAIESIRRATAGAARAVPSTASA